MSAGPRRFGARRVIAQGRDASILVILWLVLLATGCAGPSGGERGLADRVAEIGCLSECRARREQCDADARFDYRQCQAGYVDAFSDYRWCLASAIERNDCGYPWWSCAENRHGYCANRASECESACRAPSRTTASVAP